jgi:tetratricopeptide (TPR) repeat protein
MKRLSSILCLLLLAGAGFLAACSENRQETAADQLPELFQRPDLYEISMEIRNNPERADLYFARGNILHRLRQDSLALEDFKTAIRYDSSRAEYFSAIGELLFEHKDISGSVPWFQKAIDRNPADPRAHLKFAKMLIYTRDYPKAFAEINTVLRQDVFNPEAYFLKGIIYKDLKDTGKAISSFQSALNAAPDYKDAMIQLGQLYAAQGDPLALKYYENAFLLDSTDVFPLFAKGVFYQQQGATEAAKQQYRECIVRDNQYADAYYNLAFVYLEQDSVEKAHRHFDLLTRITPNDAEAYYQRGICRERMGRLQEAAIDFRQALVFEQDYPEAKAALKRVEKK